MVNAYYETLIYFLWLIKGQLRSWPFFISLARSEEESGNRWHGGVPGGSGLERTLLWPCIIPGDLLWL